MADWNGTITLSTESIGHLSTFMHQPDTRHSDIFDQGSLEATPDHRIDWIIKHDLFEGVVFQLSLMNQDGTMFLAGSGSVLQEPADILGTHTIEHRDSTYHLHVTRADA